MTAVHSQKNDIITQQGSQDTFSKLFTGAKIKKTKSKQNLLLINTDTKVNL